jgi:hypothetical protein
MPAFSTNSRISFHACDQITPPPEAMIGRSAELIASTSALIAFG